MLKDKEKMEASPKLDGIRCMIQDGIALSRSLKPIRNEHVQYILGREIFNGLDGELIIIPFVLVVILFFSKYPAIIFAAQRLPLGDQ